MKRHEYLGARNGQRGASASRHADDLERPLRYRKAFDLIKSEPSRIAAIVSRAQAPTTNLAEKID